MSAARSRSAAAYRVLLRLTPPALRRRHAAEMEALFLDALDAARRRGRRAAAAAWIAAAGDLLTARIAARRRANARATVRPHERQASMVGSDIRYALRALAQQKGAAALVVVMLALGIAANVAVFSLINGLFLRPFPYPDADRLVFINEQAPKWNLEYVGVNFPDFAAWRTNQRAFEAIAWYDTISLNLAGDRGAQRITGAQVTYDYPKYSASGRSSAAPSRRTRTSRARHRWWCSASACGASASPPTRRSSAARCGS